MFLNDNKIVTIYFTFHSAPHHRSSNSSTFMGTSWLSVRYIILALAVTSTCVDYLSRSNITMAIIAMVNTVATNETHPSLSNSSKPDDHFTCPLPYTSDPKTNETTIHTIQPLPGPKYEWNPKMQGSNKLFLLNFLIT